MKLFIVLVLFTTNVFSAINSVEQGTVIQASKLNELINKINELEQKVVPVGTIISSMLNKSQFIVQNGDCWKALDGVDSGLTTTDELRQITGLSSLPNASGHFLRNAGGSAAALNTIQSDSMQGHHHSAVGETAARTGGASTGWGISAGQAIPSLAGAGSPMSDGVNGTPRVSNETRPVNLSVMMFVKFKKQCNFN